MNANYLTNKRIIKVFSLISTILLCTAILSARPLKHLLKENNLHDSLKIYVPLELREMDFAQDSSKWSYHRSAQSAHFIVFWDKKYGNNDPNSNIIPAKYRVNIQDMLAKAENFYKENIGILKFAEMGNGKSNLDKYKMMIFLFYQDEWLAAGSGYDDVIGALWVNPTTCQPIGPIIGHEIGHCFQYQVRCDLGDNHGFRYGFGGNGGNTFWEQTAQWQSFQSYPADVFHSDFGSFTTNYNKHVLHEDYRYASYFIHYYWAQKHGIDIIGKIWRESKKPEDPIQAYQRLTNISNSVFNDEIYDQAAHLVTWDIPSIREEGKDIIGRLSYKLNLQSDGSFITDTIFAPQSTGFNVIPLEVRPDAKIVKVHFKGLVNPAGFYHWKDTSRIGWRYGFVAYCKDGSRVYGKMYKNKNAVAAFSIPQNTIKLWFVVSGAPSTYIPHAWDDNNANDETMPYQVNFEHTNVLGYLDTNIKTIPHDTSIVADIKIKSDPSGYANAFYPLNVSILSHAFALQPDVIADEMGKAIQLFSDSSNYSFSNRHTTRGMGNWFDKNGAIVSWGDSATIFSEFEKDMFRFKIGQFPNRVKPGEHYAVKQELVYDRPDQNKIIVHFKFNITIE